MDFPGTTGNGRLLTAFPDSVIDGSVKNLWLGAWLFIEMRLTFDLNSHESQTLTSFPSVTEPDHQIKCITKAINVQSS